MMRQLRYRTGGRSPICSAEARILRTKVSLISLAELQWTVEYGLRFENHLSRTGRDRLRMREWVLVGDKVVMLIPHLKCGVNDPILVERVFEYESPGLYHVGRVSRVEVNGQD